MRVNDGSVAAYKAVASAVIITAIADLKKRGRRTYALDFLTSPARAIDRSLWLAWLGFDEDGFQRLLRLRVFQNQHNKLADIIR